MINIDLKLISFNAARPCFPRIKIRCRANENATVGYQARHKQLSKIIITKIMINNIL